MFRILLITLLNMALPFLLRALYISLLKLNAKRQKKKGMKDITYPSWDFPVKKLIFIGLLLSIISIGFTRFFFTEIDTPYIGNTFKSETLK